MTNEFVEYKEYTRDHLPDGMTFDRGFYWCNNHKFGNYQQASRYLSYLIKFGYEVDPDDPVEV